MFTDDLTNLSALLLKALWKQHDASILRTEEGKKKYILPNSGKFQLENTA
jgi:hypothetical protein